jgi:CHAT domain-containing protein
LWVVDAKATEHLVSSYFDYLHKGIGRAEALRNAQLDMLRGNNERWKNPYFWAGFIESGAWSPLTPSNFVE